MKQRLCYVDPIYFIEHKMYEKASDPNSAYFDIFEELLIENYKPYIDMPNYPNYIATGFFGEELYYDVCKHEYNDTYNILISEFIKLKDIIKGLYVSILFDTDNTINNYYASLIIIDYEDMNSIGQPMSDEIIYFDNFNDLYGIIKNKLRQLCNTDTDKN